MMESWIHDLIGILPAPSAAALLGEAAPRIGSGLEFESVGLFLVTGAAIAAEGWFPADESAVPHRESLRRLALDAASEACAPQSEIVIAVEPVGDGSRLVHCGRLESGSTLAAERATTLHDVLRLAACALARLETAASAATERERHERWFRTLDQQIRVLDRERQKFAAVVGQSDLYVLVTDRDRIVRWTNKAFAEALTPSNGRPGWIGATCGEVCERLNRGSGRTECAHCPLVRAFRGNQAAHQDFRTTVGGGNHHLYLTALPIRGPDGAPHELLMLIQDLSDLRVMRKSEARYRLLFERSAMAILMVEPATHRIVLANQASTSVFGYTSAELLRLSLVNLHQPGEWLRVEAQYALAYADQHPEPFECMLSGRDGTEHMAVVQASRFDLEGREVVMLQFLDITARKRAEETLGRRERELVQAQKLEMIGRLAGGMGHEFIQLLSVIRARGEIVADLLPAGDPLRRQLSEIQGAAERAAWLTRQLQILGPRGLNPVRPLDLSCTVTGLESALRNLAGDDVSLTITCRGEPAWIRADAGQIEQILVHLVMSARQSLGEEGRIEIEVEMGPAPGAGADEGNRPSVPAPTVTLSVRDSGPGIDEETNRHLLDHQLSAGEGDGIGSGIKIAHGLANRCGARMEMESRVGEGTIVRIHFPRIDHPFMGPSRLGSKRGAEAILLVDDDDAVRAVASEVLRTEGYTVIEARDGSEALEIATRLETRLDLLLTDVVMPRMSGGELAQRMVHLWPDLRVLFLSAYTDDSIVRRGVVDAGMPFLQKPFTLESLAETVRTVLDAAAPSEPSRSLDHR
jgi:PAS domain S-box-containing protein